jgi:16S rRNA processing protein RimM
MESRPRDEPVIIGRFGRPHGVRGEVRFFAYNPDSELLGSGTRLVLPDGDVVTIEKVRSADRFEIMKIVDVDDREAAGALRNLEAGIDREAFPEPAPDEFYLVDLIGFEVFGRRTAEDELEVVGTVDGFLEGTSTEVMAVTGPKLHRRLLVPMIDDTLQNIDPDSQQIVLYPFDGWAIPDEPIFADDA